MAERLTRQMLDAGKPTPGGNPIVRLATKLALAVAFIMVAVFAVRAYETASRELARAQADLRENQYIVGRALRPAILEVWRLEGQKRALEVLDRADERIQRARKVKIAWVPLDPPSALHADLLGPTDLREMRSRDEATVVRIDQGLLLTYVPVLMRGHLEGALEISEPLEPHDQRSRAEVRAVMLRAAIGAIVSIVAVSLLGFVLIGRPLRALTDLAKRIGAGDLGGSLDLRQRDEVGELAGEMNQMSARLRSANERLREETSARIGALEQLRHVDRLRTVGTLASGIAHELGTPLNVVSGRAKMIATGEAVGDEIVESANIIVDQVDRIAKIIRQLLDFARRRAPDRGRHALAPMAEQTLSLLRPMATKKQVTMAVLPGEDIEAEVDVGQVQQALANLVVNGIQAMPNGGRLQVRLTRAHVMPPPETGGPASDHAVLTVIDQGMGIQPDAVSRVFEPFFTTKGVGEGTGLGLSVAYGIARDHGGWIAVKSEVERGSEFSLFLPIIRAPEVRS
jgi:two-component system, NtrC family, sensor kinase